MDVLVVNLIEQVFKVNVDCYVYVINFKKLFVEVVVNKWSYVEKYMVLIELERKIRDLEINIK